MTETFEVNENVAKRPFKTVNFLSESFIGYKVFIHRTFLLPPNLLIPIEMLNEADIRRY